MYIYIYIHIYIYIYQAPIGESDQDSQHGFLSVTLNL